MQYLDSVIHDTAGLATPDEQAAINAFNGRLQAGFWIMDAPDLDAARKLAAEGSKACNPKVEVRPFR